MQRVVVGDLYYLDNKFNDGNTRLNYDMIIYIMNFISS